MIAHQIDLFFSLFWHNLSSLLLDHFFAKNRAYFLLIFFYIILSDRPHGHHRRFAQGELKPGIVEERYAYVAWREELADNDYNLNIPRYVDTFEEEPEIDIAAVQQEIDALEKELSEVHIRMDGYLKELGY